MNITHTLSNMIKIDFTYCSVVNFAMHQNNVPIVRKITLTNESEESIDNVKIRLSITPNLTDEVTRVIDTIPQGTIAEIKDFPAHVQKLGYRTNRNSRKCEIKLEHRTEHPS